ncbi:MAG: MBL fold metallo-hydrolase [Candidatus Hinthialibacter antarcticus]|nr:MBL fold metallo-hydrolase [Candidatus Hinthialibacter antarcticus]
MLFQPFFFPDVNEVNTYIVGCPETKECILIDAGADSPDYDAFLKRHGASLTAVFLTHIHWDHDQALDEIVKRFNIPVYSMTGETINGKPVTEGDSLPIGNLNNRVLITTGHTPNSLSLVVENTLAFVGDAIFAGSIGGTSSEELKQEEVGHIQTKLFALPGSCLLCSGHGPITTVSIEKNANPFVCMV